MLGNVAQEILVELDEVRRQFDQQVQVGIARAEIVQCALHAEVTRHRQRLGKAGEVVDGRLLGQLDDDARGVQIVVGNRVQEAGMVLQQLAHAKRAEIQEQLARQAHGREIGNGQARGRGLQRNCALRVRCRGKQRGGRHHGRARRPTQQRLVTKHLGGGQAEDRLEHRTQHLGRNARRQGKR